MRELHLTEYGWIPVHVPAPAVCCDSSTDCPAPASKVAPVHEQARTDCPGPGTTYPQAGARQGGGLKKGITPNREQDSVNHKGGTELYR